MGEGKDQQLFMNTNVNSKIRDQHQNNARILVFKRNDAESCIFFDEYEFVKYETINNKILFTYKSILRYKTFWIWTQNIKRWVFNLESIIFVHTSQHSTNLNTVRIGVHGVGHISIFCK